MNCIEFFLPMNPPTATHQMKAVHVVNGKPVFYEPAAVKNARATLTAHLARHAPKEPMQGPLWLIVKWCFPASKAHPANTWRVTRPDTDNLQKMLKDCMTSLGFWNDDAQVCREIIEKFWVNRFGIYVHLEQVVTESDAHV